MNSPGDLQQELDQRTRALNEALEQQTAIGDILRVISSSPGEVKPVFEAVAERAAHICKAQFVSIMMVDDAMIRNAAEYGDLGRLASDERVRLDRSTVMGRSICDRSIVHVADMLEAAGDFPLGRELAARFGHRTTLCVPLLHEDRALGTILVRRTEVRPFEAKHIALLKTFADQAAIAIENARLLNEVREQAIQLEAQSQELRTLNQQLEQRVSDQVGEIERMGRLRRFLPPQVADLIVSSGSEKQLESHRREITALFCDLRGFTGFSETSDPEDVMALLREYHKAIGEIIFRHGGTLERFAGDGVMVIFGDPVPLENPALAAVQMALEMRAAIGTLVDKWSRLGHELGFGIGISHGYATLGTIGFEGRFDYAAIGMVSNVASRLCDEARPGQILISPRVLMAVGDAVSLEPVAEMALKGIRRPILVHNVLGAAAVTRASENRG
jgi:adenylate cyclase